MSRVSSRTRTLLAVAVAALLAGCGGSGGSSTSSSSGSVATTQNTASTQSANGNQVVAHVGTVAITKGQVNQWMNDLGGGSFYYVSHGSTVPSGLLGDPPDYPRCVSSLEAAAAKSPLGHARENSVELLTKCRELSREFKLDAVRYLISEQQGIAIARGMGASATPAQVQAFYRSHTLHEYPTTAALRDYLTTHVATVADLLFEDEVTALAQQAYPKLRTTSGARRYLALRAKAIAATTCQPGYVVEGCSEHNVESYKVAPNALMEQVTAMEFGWCVDLKGCAKQIGQ